MKTAKLFQMQQIMPKPTSAKKYQIKLAECSCWDMGVLTLPSLANRYSDEPQNVIDLIFTVAFPLSYSTSCTDQLEYSIPDRPMESCCRVM